MIFDEATEIELTDRTRLRVRSERKNRRPKPQRRPADRVELLIWRRNNGLDLFTGEPLTDDELNSPHE